MRRCFIWLCCLSLWLGHSSAQSTFRGGIAGIVTDASGAVIPGAAIQVQNNATDLVYKIISSSSGDYSVEDLPIGDYSVTITYKGFTDLKISNVRVSAGSIFSLPAKMTVGQTSTVVEVAAAALTLDTTTPVQTYTIPREEVQDIPLDGRSFTTMVNFIPGYTGNVNGSAHSINYMVDGVDNNDPANNGTAANQGGVGSIPGTLIPIDAIEEFSTQAGGGAEVGKFAGAAVNLVIKSGTNTPHGSLYYFDRNEAFAALNPFVKAANAIPGAAQTGKAKIRFAEYGGSVGGPIIKDKTFYFLSFERQSYILGQSSTPQTEPSNAYIAEATALLATHNIAPAASAVPLIHTLWQANMLNGPASANNYLPASANQTGFSNNMMAKFDHTLNQDNHLVARWYWGQGSQTAPKGSLNPWYFQVAGMHVDNIAVILNSAINAKVANQIVAGVDYFNQPFSDANPNVNPAAAGFAVGLGPGSVQGAPSICIGSSSACTSNGDFDGTGQSPYSERHDFSAHLSDIASFTLGKHQLRAGGEYRRVQIYEVGDGAGENGGTRGEFSFSGTRGFAAPQGVQVGTPYPASFIYNGATVPVDSYLAEMTDYLQMEASNAGLVNGNLDRIASINNFDLYAEDAYQVLPDLNLNVGLRWDYLSPIGDDQRDLTVFDPSVAANPLDPSGGLAVVGQDVSEPYKAALQLGPRLGISWQPPILHDATIRAGFGLYYDTPATNTWLSPSGLLGNPAGTRPDYNESLIYPRLQDLISSQGSIFPSSPSLPGLCSAAYLQTAVSCPVVNIAAVNPNFTLARTANYSLNIEKSFGQDVIAQIGYVGTQGKHLQNLYDLNQTAFGAALNLSPAGAKLAANANGFAPSQYERPYYAEFPNYGYIDEINDGAFENFNSLQALIKTRNWHGLISEYSYTWSHNLGSPTGVATDNRFPALDYGNLSNDIRDQAKGYFFYQVPGLENGPQWLTHGWQLSSALWFHTGKPITANSKTDETGLGENGDRASLSGQRLYCSAASAGACNKATSKSLAFGQTKTIQWFNPSAIVAPAPLTYGTTHMGQFYGPGYGDIDLSVLRNVSIHERISAQFRAEMFNILNRYNYANPSLSTNCSLTQVDSNTCAVTTGLVTATTGGSSAPGIGAGEPFNVQFAVKILF